MPLFKLSVYEIFRSITCFLLNFSSSFVFSKRFKSSEKFKSRILDSPSNGHLKCPFSNLLKYSQNPFSSQRNIFKRLRGLLQNTNTVSPNGSRLNASCTTSIRPLIDFLISVLPHARYTAVSFSIPNIF